MSSVLIVDDNPDQVFLTRHLLEREGFTCTAAADAAAAWEALIAGRADVVLLDLHLGRDDGWTLLERMRADPRVDGVPVVVMTASRDEAIIARARSLGADYLDKTLLTSELIGHVRAAIPAS